MTALSLKSSMGRTFRRVRDRWRALSVVKWLSKQEDVLWIFIIEPTLTAQQAGFPKLEKYRGLRAITEVRSASGSVEWHFLWATESAANEHEPDVSNNFASTGTTRIAVRAVEIPKKSWWKRLLPWFATVGLAGVAAIASQLETINTFRLELQHQPDMTLESSEAIQVDSDSIEKKEITLWGDPFFRSQLTNFSMQILPDPEFPGTAALPNGGKVPVPAWHRSVDIGKEVKLILPFNKVPPGRYLVILHGEVHTAWRSAEMAPQDPPLRLDARAPVVGQKNKVTPWAPDGVATEKFPQALLDIDLVFGRPKHSTSTVRVVLTGQWVGWWIDDLRAGVQLERQSQNSPQHPKSVVFALRNLPSENFSSQRVRVRVQAPIPLTNDEWQKKVPQPITEFSE